MTFRADASAASARPHLDRQLGSAAGLRRVARLGDGWLASAYNTNPERIAAGKELLHDEMACAGRDVRDVPIVLATMWTYVTESADLARDRLADLAAMLG